MKTSTKIGEEEWVKVLYESLLNRAPRPQELARYSQSLRRGGAISDFLLSILRSPEYAERRRVRPSHPPGHFYSPVVDPREVEKRGLADSRVAPDRLKGLHYPVEAMVAFWRDHVSIIAGTSFHEDKNAATRYYWKNHIFPASDAAILRAIVLRSRPTQIVEVGSGFSTACMLDAMDEGGLAKTEITCVEPYPQRLYGLLREPDRKRLRIMETTVQEAPMELFTALGAGDVLFIDSTHVLKTGSDVHHELFEILPSLQPGVFIHFHDIHYPFEYPRGWIFEKGYSWNEIYALRAFLMYNDAFEITFHGSYFAAWHADLVRQVYPLFLRNPGGSLWLKKKERTHCAQDIRRSKEEEIAQFPSSQQKALASGRDKKREALLVVGMHRSGTSALAGMLASFGATAPKTLMSPNRHNERGYWESQKFCEFNDRMLHLAGVAWSDSAAISDAFFRAAEQQFNEEFQQLLEQEYGEARLLCIKDPRLCRLLPFWLPQLEACGVAAKAVLPVRHPMEVARSLEAREGFEIERALALWLCHNLEAELHTRGIPRVLVRYEDLLRDWRAVARRIARKTGIKWPRPEREAAAEVDAFLDPALRHHASAAAVFDVRAPLDGWLGVAYDRLQALAAGKAPRAAMKALDRLRDEFGQSAFARKRRFSSRTRAASSS